MAAARRVSDFPWTALDRLDRGTESTLRSARRWLELAARPQTFVPSLARILGADLKVYLRSVDTREPDAPMTRLGFDLAGGPGGCVVGLEPALAAVLLAKLLRRPPPMLHPDSQLDPPLQGALAALLIEAARGAGSERVLRPVPVSIAPDSAIVHLTAILDDRPYGATLWIPPRFEPLPAALSDKDLTLARFNALEIGLPLVVAFNLASPRDLTRLTAGAAWCPGAGWLVDAKLEGQGILVAGTSERGLSVDLGPNGRIVLRETTTAALTAPEGTPMNSDETPEPTTLTAAVLEAPVVVRVELGSVSLKAREWLALRPGDVVETGRRIAEPVALRSGGRLIARGELVNIEGEIGVRVTEVLGEES